MAHLEATVGLDASQALPVVRKIGTNREALPRSRSRLVAFRTRCGLKQTRKSACQQKPWASFAK
jgi:hypothetical protein